MAKGDYTAIFWSIEWDYEWYLLQLLIPLNQFLSRVVLGNRRRLRSFQKQRKALFFDQRVEKWELCSGVHARTTGRGWDHCIEFLLAGGEQSPYGGAAAALLKFQIAVLGTVSSQELELVSWSWGISTVMLHQELWSEVLGAHGILWARKTKWSTKEKKIEKVRLYFITQILFLFPRTC